jgi:predicted dehydrogenase
VSQRKTNLAFLGGGLKSRLIFKDASEHFNFVALVDPTPAGGDGASEMDLPLYESLRDALSDHQIDGVIVCTTARETIAASRAALECQIPTLVIPSKGTSLEASQDLVSEAKKAAVPLLVGNQRRFHPSVIAAKEFIALGGIGTIIAAQSTSWFPKSEAKLSDIHWASRQGHIPILNDLIDDLDVLRYLLGEVLEISGITTSHIGGNAVPSSLGCLLKFENDVICTVNASDEVVSQANWYVTAGETDKYSKTGQSCLWIGGTEGTLSIPDLALWSYGEREASWDSRLQVEKIKSNSSVGSVVAELLDFESVIQDKKVPVCSGEDALNSMRLVEMLYDRLS